MGLAATGDVDVPKLCLIVLAPGECSFKVELLTFWRRKPGGYDCVQVDLVEKEGSSSGKSKPWCNTFAVYRNNSLSFHICVEAKRLMTCENQA